MTIRIAPAALFALALPFAAAAQAAPEAHFLDRWDLNGDGQVTSAEATEMRGDVFAMFDANDDGVLSRDEYKEFDAVRAADREMMQEEHRAALGQPGQGQGQGQGQGLGQRQAMGQGHHQGQAKGQGQHHAQERQGGFDLAAADQGMQRGFNDVNGDGQVTRDEFVGRAPAWLRLMDHDGNGAITAADFGPKAQ